MELGDVPLEEPFDWKDEEADRERAYGGRAAARRNVHCECGHPASSHEGDEFGFCLVCDCNHYRPAIRSVTH